MTIKFVIVEIVLLETVLMGDPLYLKCLQMTKMPPKLKYFSMCMQSATDTARIQLEYTLDTDDAQSQDNCTKMTTSAALLHSTEDGTDAGDEVARSQRDVESRNHSSDLGGVEAYHKWV